MYVNRCGVIFVLFLTLSLGFSKGFSQVRSIQLQRRPTRPAQLQDFEIRFCCTAAGVQDCFAEQWQRDFRCLPTFLASRNTTARPSKLRENFCRAMTGHSERLRCNTGALHEPASGRPRTNFFISTLFSTTVDPNSLSKLLVSNRSDKPRFLIKLQLLPHMPDLTRSCTICLAGVAPAVKHFSQRR